MIDHTYFPSYFQMMTICSADYHDVSELCYDFWMNKGHITDETMCTNHRRYKKLSPTQSLTWNQAQNMCRLGGGNLVTINSFEELQLLRMVLLDDINLHGQTSIHIGLQIQQQCDHQQQQKRQHKQQMVGDHK